MADGGYTLKKDSKGRVIGLDTMGWGDYDGLKSSIAKPAVSDIRKPEPLAPAPIKTTTIDLKNLPKTPASSVVDTRPMRYHEGTRRVPKTGPAILKEGEAVVPAEKNPYSKITEGEAKPPKKVHEIRTRRSKNGGYIHEHHHTEPTHHKMEEHTSHSLQEMLDHMKEHMGEEGEPGEEAKETTGTAQQEQALGMEQ